jgi:PAS domain S-box-containing protein
MYIGWPQPLRTMVRLILNTGHPMYIWWGPDCACLYNDAYRESIGPERHPGSLGRPAHEVWAEIWPVIQPQIQQVLSGGGATWNVDHLVPITRHGRREDVYWTYSYSPIDDPEAPSGIGGVLVVCRETTQQVINARRLTAERDELKQLFEQAPTFMAMLSGPEHSIAIANPAYLRLVGHRDVVGKTVAEALPEAAGQGYLTLLDRVFATGEAFTASAARFDVQATPGGPLEERFLDFVYQPIRDDHGAVTGIFVVGAEVTERTLADRSLRESEARFRAALRAGRMGSWETDLVARTRQWSAEGSALFGLDPGAGQGQVGGPFDEYANSLHPEDRPLVEHYRSLADRQDSFAAEYRIVKGDGSTLWLSGRGQVVERGPDGRARRLINIMADATERKIAEEQLRAERERLALALRAGGMGAYEFDLDRNVLWWSSEMYGLFGVSTDTFVPSAQGVLELIHPEDRDEFMRLRELSMAERRPFTHEFRIVRPDGVQAWLAHRGHADYDAGGRPLRTFGVTIDITERKHVEELLRDAEKKKDDFLAVLAHELRNPLAPIRNAIAILRRTGAVEKTAAWCFDVIDRQVTQMTRLLDDLLDVSHLSRGRLRLRPAPIRLTEAIERAVEVAQPLIDAAGHSFSVETPPEALVLDGDLARLTQVFSNLLINAAKFTPRGGAIAVAIEREGDEAVTRVIDSGIGISAGDLTHIFEIFGQVDSSQGHAQGGQGIGLALARGLVEVHGGTLTVQSAGAGRGSTFEVRLPLVGSPRSPARELPVV